MCMNKTWFGLVKQLNQQGKNIQHREESLKGHANKGYAYSDPMYQQERENQWQIPYNKSALVNTPSPV